MRSHTAKRVPKSETTEGKGQTPETNEVMTTYLDPRLSQIFVSGRDLLGSVVRKVKVALLGPSLGPRLLWGDWLRHSSQGGRGVHWAGQLVAKMKDHKICCKILTDISHTLYLVGDKASL